ncbi:MAG: GTPase Era [Clostridiales bacterium]|nr:GTPase Era [Clostridiales bacterium]
MIKTYGDEYRDIIEKVVKITIEKHQSNYKDIDVEINLVDNEEIRILNKRTRNIDKVTDVLSFQNIQNLRFPIDTSKYLTEINPQDNSLMLGEIFICLDKALEQAIEYGHSIEREIGFLTCHGLLHLLGYDHNLGADSEKMEKITEEIMKEANLEREKSDNKSQMAATDFKSGFVAIMGKPNAGKSTLINTLVGEKVAIVSWKPQTTRNKILGIYNEPSYQIIFIDTPGLHKPKNSLGKYMMRAANSALDGIDCLLYLIDAEKQFDQKDKENIAIYLDADIKVIAVVNKVDRVTKEKVFGILTELKNFAKLQAVVPISALRGRNIEPLKEEIKKLLTDHIKYYDKDQYTDKNMRFIASEIIREKALRLLNMEVPYGIGVDITKYQMRESGDIIDIDADIICEKAAHKPIILGKGGSMIKNIGTYARQDLENITGSKVFLTLFVKVRTEWRENSLVLKELGYDN